MVFVSRSVRSAAVPPSTGGSPLVVLIKSAPLLSAPAARLRAAFECPPWTLRLSSLRCGGCGMAHKLETQRAGDGRSLDQLDGHGIAEPMGFGIADEGATRLVKAEI